MKIIFSLITTLLLTSCGSLVPTVKLDDVSVEKRRAVSSLEIFNQNQLIGKNYSIITIVEGISCKNKVWDPAATKTDALLQTKHWAREAGADAITNLQCDSPRGTTVTYNCWESITCTAEAIKFK